MTEERSYLISRTIGIVIGIVVDTFLSYKVGHYFHSVAIGLTVWFILGRLLSTTDGIRELKRDRGLK